MPYDPNIHHRRSIRLKGYDYSQEGLYFITLCIQNKDCLFGEIVENQMLLNDAGKMVEKWVRELKNKYPGIDFGEYVVMPNHFHCIIEILSGNVVEKIAILKEKGTSVLEKGASVVEKGASVVEKGASVVEKGASVVEKGASVVEKGAHTGAPLRERTSEKYGMNNIKYNATIGDMLDWFKTMSTNEYIRGVKSFNWKRFDRKLWQVNYWEHIIREQQSYENISGYISDNPAKWKDDKLYME